jgi:uncharacterized ferritin-like protein (DUF455 family)
MPIHPKDGRMLGPIESVAAACRSVLLAAEPRDKVRLARSTARAWRRGELARQFDVAMPNAPARPRRPELLPPSRMPKRGKAAARSAGRIAMLHALAHIEFAAIDLAFDLAGRFGAGFPPEFVDDWLRRRRRRGDAFRLARPAAALARLGYGACRRMTACGKRPKRPRTIRWPAGGVPMVLEARGLDVTPATVARFEAAGDARSAAILAHLPRRDPPCRGGSRWFGIGCEAQRIGPVSHWQRLVGPISKGREAAVQRLSPA